MQVTELRILYNIYQMEQVQRKCLEIKSRLMQKAQRRKLRVHKMRETSNNSSQLYNQHLVDKKGRN